MYIKELTSYQRLAIECSTYVVKIAQVFLGVLLLAVCVLCTRFKDSYILRPVKMRRMQSFLLEDK